MYENKKILTTSLKFLRPAMLTVEELICIEPQFKNLTPEKKAKFIGFVYE